VIPDNWLRFYFLPSPLFFPHVFPPRNAPFFFKLVPPPRRPHATTSRFDMRVGVIDTLVLSRSRTRWSVYSFFLPDSDFRRKLTLDFRGSFFLGMISSTDCLSLPYGRKVRAPLLFELLTLVSDIRDAISPSALLLLFLSKSAASTKMHSPRRVPFYTGQRPTCPRDVCPSFFFFYLEEEFIFASFLPSGLSGWRKWAFLVPREVISLLHLFPFFFLFR